MSKPKSKLTLSVHAGSPGDSQYRGVVTPIFPSSAYDYEGGETLYPRYFNTPNHTAVAEKLAALENGEEGLVFSSGMAAILTSIFGMMKQGDHAVLQSDLYGGTHAAVVEELPRYGMSYTMVNATDLTSFERAIRPETKIIYIETPSNPTLKITDINGVVGIAQRHGIITIIDNTFASPINQNPIDLGIDIVVHSGTKYLGGHSDLSCGAVVTTKALADTIRKSALHFGGSLDPQTCWLVERSLKTLVLRVRQQNINAMTLAEYLSTDSRIAKVYYPGLTSHPGHDIAREQMPGGFGGMLSFELKADAHPFMERLRLIKRAISLGGVESTITSPAKTSHAKMSREDRNKIGVTDNLIRLSVGIEDPNDLIADIEQALSSN